VESAKHYFGKVCAKHPELKGERHSKQHRDCLGCQKERLQRRYKTATYRAQKREQMRHRYQTNAGYRAQAKKSVLRYQRERYATDPAYRLLYTMRRRIRNVLRGTSKSTSTLALLGVPSVAFYQAYLESQFQVGMTWDNYGPAWHIDHRIPLSLIDLSTPENQRFGFNYKNTRPMWAKANVSRGNRLVFEDLL
jgi:hypothetical protein